MDIFLLFVMMLYELECSSSDYLNDSFQETCSRGSERILLLDSCLFLLQSSLERLFRFNDLVAIVVSGSVMFFKVVDFG